MRFLLDTHTFLWFVGGSPQLSATARRVVIEEPGAELLVSIASAWEVAIKMSLGKLVIHEPI